VVGASTKWSLRFVVWFGIVKIATLLLYVGSSILGIYKLTLTLSRISIAGLVVLGGHTKVVNPQINWHNAWEGTSKASAYGATNAMIKLIFSYTGYQNAFSVVNEIKVSQQA